MSLFPSADDHVLAHGIQLEIACNFIKTGSMYLGFYSPTQPPWGAARQQSRAKIAPSVIRVSENGFLRNRSP